MLLELEDSPRFEPRFSTYAGLSIELEDLGPGEEGAPRYRGTWKRNGARFAEIELEFECGDGAGQARCARDLVALGEEFFSEEGED